MADKHRNSEQLLIFLLASTHIGTNFLAMTPRRHPFRFSFRFSQQPALLLLLAAVALLPVGCDQPTASIQEKLIGSWTADYLVSNEAFRQMSHLPPEGGPNMTIRLHGTVTYAADQTSESSMQAEYTLESPEETLQLQFQLDSTGTWSLSDDMRVLNETTVLGEFTPLDESTETALQANPTLAAIFKPIHGKTSTSEIVAISESTMELNLESPPMNLRLTKVKACCAQ